MPHRFCVLSQQPLPTMSVWCYVPCVYRWWEAAHSFSLCQHGPFHRPTSQTSPSYCIPGQAAGAEHIQVKCPSWIIKRLSIPCIIWAACRAFLCRLSSSRVMIDSREVIRCTALMLVLCCASSVLLTALLVRWLVCSMTTSSVSCLST